MKPEPYFRTELGELYCGDCLEILPTIPAGSIDLILTDPPYKVSQLYGGGVDADNLVNVSSILKSMPMLSEKLKSGRFAVVFYDNRILPFLFESIKGTELIYRRQIFLYRRWGNANRWVGWMQCTDPICIFVKGHTEPFNPKIKADVKHDVYVKSKPENDDTGHPAQKPIEIISDIVLWCSDKDDLVIDPYMGSGTTAWVCEQLGRRWLGIEKSKEYCDMTISRLKKQGEQRRLDIQLSNDSSHKTQGLTPEHGR